jgi:ATP-dependent exoDNAse (exonuclease V) beta subunit
MVRRGRRYGGRLSAIGRKRELREFLSTLVGVRRRSTRPGGVRLMTIHASKGLEFDVVYVPGCEDSILPCTLSEADGVDLEEEKRLLYVAMTRAKTDLILSWAEKRTVYGKTMKRKRSPFLSAIEDALLRHEAAAVKRGSPRGTGSFRSSIEEPIHPAAANDSGPKVPFSPPIDRFSPADIIPVSEIRQVTPAIPAFRSAGAENRPRKG